MKKVINVWTVSFIFFLGIVLASKVNAQDKVGEDFFLGKWKITAYGLPQGDTEMIFFLEKKEGKLEGNIGDGKPENAIKFSKVELKDKSVTVYYTAQGYDVYMTLEKVDENKVSGSMMDMFDLKGVKVKI